MNHLVCIEVLVQLPLVYSHGVSIYHNILYDISLHHDIFLCYDIFKAFTCFVSVGQCNVSILLEL